MGAMARKTTRGSHRVQLQVDSARTIRIPQLDGDQPLLPWPLASIGGGVLAALAGCLVVAGITFIGWVSVIAIPVADMLSFAGRGWLLVNGGRLTVGSGEITLAPLTLTFAMAALAGWVGAFGYRQARLAAAAEPSRARRAGLIALTAVQVCVGYTAFTAGIAWGVGELGAERWVIGAAGLSLFSAVVGAVLADGYLVAARWPRWVRASVRGAGAGALALLLVAAVVLLVAVLLGAGRIQSLEDAIGFDGGGLVVWGAVLVGYLPNLLGWALAWALGGGFSVGSQTLVSLWTTQLGMLPAIPAFGALPSDGPSDPWLLSWLGAGVVVGVIAGAVAARASGSGPVLAIAASGGAGVLTGVVFFVWLAISGGGLGLLRMAEIGPRLLDSALIGMPLLALSALLAGAVFAVVQHLGDRRRGAAG